MAATFTRYRSFGTTLTKGNSLAELGLSKDAEEIVNKLPPGGSVVFVSTHTAYPGRNTTRLATEHGVSVITRE